MPRSLTGRLMLASMMAMLLATTAAVAMLLLLAWPRSTASLMAPELEEEIQHVRNGLRVDASGRIRVMLDPKEANVYDAMPADAAYRVLGPDGRVLVESRAGHALDVLAGKASNDARPAAVNGADDLVLQTVHRSFDTHGHRYDIQVARSHRLVSTLSDYAGTLYVRAGAVTVIMALLTFAIAVYLTIRRLLRPIANVSAAAVEIGPRNLARRLDGQGLPSELAPLIEAFNAALIRLENGYRVQQEFLASAAHELKTPLALLQAEIELGSAANRELLLRDTRVMARQVHQLLHLAEVSEGHNYAFKPLQPGVVLADAADYLSRVAARHGVGIELDAGVEAGFTVMADASAVFVLTKNLLENAIHHAPPGTMVTLAVDAEGFSVTDRGPGVAPADTSRLFERFWRGTTRDGEGAGLGLAICQEICTAHGWSIALAPGSASGARFEVGFRSFRA